MGKSLEELHYFDLPPFFSDTEVANIVPGTEDRRYALLKRAMARGDLLHMRKGVYCVAKRYQRKALNLYSIAQRMYGPSYVSFESALSYRSWIPEAVPWVTSACVRRSREFQTPLGAFTFTRVPAKVFLAHVERLVSDADSFFMATPWRAIADYIYAHGKEWKGIHPLIHSLRIDEEYLQAATRDELEDLDRSFGKARVSAFLNGVIRELNL